MLALTLLLFSATPDGGFGPSPRELAQLFFLAGDLHRAVEVARKCLEVEKKKCEPFYRALVEYQALIPRNEELTPAEAKAYLEWDHLISPKEPGKLTVPVLKRYVEAPLEAAKRAQAAGDTNAVKQIAERVLQIDPKNAEAKELLAPPKK